MAFYVWGKDIKIIFGLFGYECIPHNTEILIVLSIYMVWLSRNTILIHFDKKAIEVGSYSEDIALSNLISHVSFPIWVPPRLFLFK